MLQRSERRITLAFQGCVNLDGKGLLMAKINLF